MKYMLAMLTVPDEALQLSSDDIKAIETEHAGFRSKYEASGTLLNGAGVLFRKDSLVVGRSGKKAEPIASTRGKPEMTTYHIVECATDDETAGIAGELLDHHAVQVEIRKVHHSSGM